jgi:hypothetical protein
VSFGDVEPKFEQPDHGSDHGGHHGSYRRGFFPVGDRYAAAHDRALGTILGLLSAVTVSRHLVDTGRDPMSALAIGLYLPAGVVGYYAGKACPDELRAALQAAATAALTMVGMGTFGGNF